jgi:hypothetical protein
MTSERRAAMKYVGLRLKHGAWQLRGKPQVTDDQVDAIPDADWQTLITRWRRNRVR